MTTLDRLIPLIDPHVGSGRERTITADDTFDALGIDSLDRWELVTELEDAFGVPIPDAVFNECSSVGQLAAAIDELGPTR